MDYNKSFKKGIHDIKKATLSKSEKEGMLARLTEYAEEHPIVAPKKVGIFNTAIFQIRQYKSAYALALASLLIIIGGNISYVAAQSLPGDMLYPIKINVNEKIQGVLKLTPKSSAKWEEKKIERRLEEVNTLVEKGEFDTKKRIQVEKEVRKNVNSIRKSTQENELEKRVESRLKKIHETEDNKRLEREQRSEVRELKNKIRDSLFEKRNGRD